MLFRSISLKKVDDEKLLNQLQTHPELAAAVRVLDVQLSLKDFILNLDCDNSASANPQPEALCNTRLSTLELCTRACHLVIGGVVPEQRERLVGILDGLRSKSIIYSEWDWGGNWPTEQEPVYLSVLELDSLAQRLSLQNFEVYFRKTRPAYNPLLAPISSLYSPVAALSIDFTHTNGAARLIAMTAATLRRLKVASWNPLPGTTLGAIFASLSFLEELDVFVFSNHEDAETSWFPTTLPSLVSLRHLVVNTRFANLSTLLSAPPTLELLEYSQWRRSDAAVFRDLQATLNSRSSGLPYSTLRIPTIGTLGAEAQRERAALVGICRNRGVELQVIPARLEA